jgi:excisionase family DNA binding protein
MSLDIKEIEGSILHTPAQTAHKLKLSRGTLDRLTRQGVIPVYKLGSIIRYDLEKVLAALAAYEKPAKLEPHKFSDLKGRHNSKAVRVASATPTPTTEEAI